MWLLVWDCFITWRTGTGTLSYCFTSSFKYLLSIQRLCLLKGQEHFIFSNIQPCNFYSKTDKCLVQNLPALPASHCSNSNPSLRLGRGQQRYKVGGTQAARSTRWGWTAIPAYPQMTRACARTAQDILAAALASGARSGCWGCRAPYPARSPRAPWRRTRPGNRPAAPPGGRPAPGQGSAAMAQPCHNMPRVQPACCLGIFNLLLKRTASLLCSSTGKRQPESIFILRLSSQIHCINMSTSYK